MRLTLQEIAKACGGKTTADGEITSVSIDTRTVTAGSLFIAIKGDRFDAHDFVEQAVQNGAAAVMCHKEVETTVPVIYVEDTARALLELSGYYRSLFPNLRLVGLTGSVGKTTTKEMVYAVLSRRYKTLKTEGNLNNEIGMPRTLLRLEADTEAAVIEMGMSNFGEISRMVLQSRPEIGIITNIGVSHIEYLGSRDGILKAKLELLEGLKKGGALILNGDDDKLSAVRHEDFKLIFFGINNPDCAVRASDISEENGETAFTVHFSGGTALAKIPTVGVHNVYDALAAFAVGLEAGLSPEEITAGLMDYMPSGMRQRIKTAHDITVIEDCYNASPDSQKAALKVLANTKVNRKIAVLGDMLELGSYSETAHREVGAFAAECKIDALYTLGEQARLIAKAAKGIEIRKSFTDSDALFRALYTDLRAGDAVLFKASRGMHLEDIINKLYKEWDVK